jgi:putative pyruvate formate lyase activating enzyme
MERQTCTICPRSCNVARASGVLGLCGMPTEPVLARAALHMWEEPCISGSRGSGTVFFSGCPLKCVFCQNTQISAGGFGKQVSVSRLREIFFELIDQGAHNINLVNPTHFADAVLTAIGNGLPVPIVYNTGGYDRIDTLTRFAGKIDIYLPDFKYTDGNLAERYAAAADYPHIAKLAILEMFRQTGPWQVDSNGLLQKGVVIRHLILPGCLDNTFHVIDWVADTFQPGDVLFSLMSQYTPCGDLTGFPELQRRLTQAEYNAAMEYLAASGIEDGFFQELSSAKEEYIPDFDLSGV